MAYAPQFTISPRPLTLVEMIAALRERILGAAVELSWIFPETAVNGVQNHSIRKLPG
jgi:hypothetical protein